jgi:HSP20 family molecular chaperone IbpA
MNSTMLPSLRNPGRSDQLDHASSAFRQPSYECKETRDGMQIIVYIPGVDASGIEIEGRGADLTVTAQKAHFVRVNFDALNLEGVQRDYLLRLRLGTGFDYANMAAEVAAGVLTIRLPKRTSDRQIPRLRRAA